MMRVHCSSLRMRPGNLWLGVALVLAVVGAGLVMGGISSFSLGPVTKGAPLFLPLLGWRMLGKLERGDRLEVETGRLRVAGRDVAIERIVSAHVESLRLLIFVLRDGRRIEVLLADMQPDRLLELLGWHADTRVLEAPLRGTLGAFTQGALAFFSTIFGILWLGVVLRAEWLLPAAPLLAIALTILVVRRFGSPRVMIGRDGVRIERGWRPRFVPAGELLGAEVVIEDDGRPQHGAGYVVTALGVQLSLRGGEIIKLPLMGQSPAQAQSLVARVEDLLSVGQARRADAFPMLERAGRGVAEWREALEGALGQHGGYRQRALPVEQLEPVLRDVHAPAERRLEAALALRIHAPELTEQIVRAADTSADPAMRAALLAVSEDTLDQELFDRALAAK